MTNLLAAIAVAVFTNVVETDNGHWEQPNAFPFTPCNEGIHGNVSGSTWNITTPDHRNDTWVPATEKTITTTVVERHTLTFRWRDKEWTARDDVVLSETVRRLRLVKEERWEPVKGDD